MITVDIRMTILIILIIPRDLSRPIRIRLTPVARSSELTTLSLMCRGNYVIFVRSIQTLQLILLERELIALFNGILIVKKY